MLHELIDAFLKTILIAVLASIPVTIIGMLISTLHVMLKRRELYHNNYLAKPIELIVKACYQLPSIVLLIAFIPATKIITDNFASDMAVITPIVLATLPVFIYHASQALNKVPNKLVTMALVNGASKVQIVKDIIVKESMADLIRAYSTTLMAIISCSIIAGIIGVQGLGRLLLEKGYRTFDANYVIGIILSLILLNFLINKATKLAAAKR